MMDRDYWVRDLLMLSLLLGVLFGYGLGHRALWSPDEGRYSEIPREMVASGDYITPRLNGVKYFEKPPFFYWLQSLSIRLFGLNEWSLRLWSATFAALGCLAVYVSGRSLFGQRAGLISVVVLATGLLYFAMSRIITLDMAVSVLLSCSLLAFLLGTREPMGPRRRVAMWTFFVFAALATLTKGLIGIVIPAVVIGSWMALVNEWRILRTMSLSFGLALFLLIALPWHVLVSQANPEFANFYFIHEHFQRYLTKHRGPFHRAWAFVPVLLLGLFPWSAFLAQALRYNLPLSWRQRHQHKEALFLILWAGLVFVFFSASSSKLIPYILPMFPPLAILIGRYFSAVWERRDRVGIQVGYWVFLAASFLLIVVGLAVAPHRVEGYSDPMRFTAHLYMLTAVLMVGALTTLILGRRMGFPKAFLSMTVTAVLMLIVMSSSLLLFDQSRSVKGLAGMLKPRLQPGDIVASYHAYYQDLPVYLQRQVTIVGWRGELGFGAQTEDVSGWIIDDAALWKKWDGPATVYILMDRERYEKLRLRPDHKLYPIVQTDFHVLLTNKVGSMDDRRQGTAHLGLAGFGFPNRKQAKGENV